MTPAQTEAKIATLYRMVMDKHICPYGLKSNSRRPSVGKG